MEVVKDFDNKLLGRREVHVKIDSSGVTPRREEAKASIAKKFKVDENLVIVKKVSSNYGGTKVSILANIYLDRKNLEAITLKHLLKRNEKPELAEGGEE